MDIRKEFKLMIQEILSKMFQLIKLAIEISEAVV